MSVAPQLAPPRTSFPSSPTSEAAKVTPILAPVSGRTFGRRAFVASDRGPAFGRTQVSSPPIVTKTLRTVIHIESPGLMRALAGVVEPADPSERAVPFENARRAVASVLARFEPVFEPVGADAAFVELNGVIGESMAHRAALKLKASLGREWCVSGRIGVGSNKLVARMACSGCSVRGSAVAQLNPATYRESLAATPVEHLWTIGARTAARLHKLGIRTLSELARADRSVLCDEFGVVGRRLHDLARGRDESPVVGLVDPLRSPMPACPSTRWVPSHSLGQETPLEAVTHTGTTLEGLLLGYSSPASPTAGQLELVGRTGSGR